MACHIQTDINYFYLSDEIKVKGTLMLTEHMTSCSQRALTTIFHWSLKLRVVHFPENRSKFCIFQVSLAPAHIGPEKMHEFRACYTHSFLGLVTPIDHGEDDLHISDKGRMLIYTPGLLHSLISL